MEPNARSWFTVTMARQQRSNFDRRCGQRKWMAYQPAIVSSGFDRPFVDRRASELGAPLMTDRDILDVLRRAAVWFEANPDGFGPLLDAIGDARLVLIGEASHGTHEFYHARAELTKALVQGKGFNVVAVEADWPDAYRANQWVRGVSRNPDAEAALDDFTRFPRWM